jgi:hypothetical protein
MIKLWKSMSEGLRSGYGNMAWEIGKWYKIKGKLEMCQNGFHASEKIFDAMQWVNLENLAQVEVRGKSIIQDDKQCWSEMRIIKVWKWTKQDSVALAIFAAELVIDNFEKEYPKDHRPRKAIEAAKKWLENPTEKNRKAAEAVAWSTAWSTAWYAWSTARSAARSAWSAWVAARSAKSTRPAWPAWFAAESAARSAAWSVESAWAAARSVESAWAAARSAKPARSAWSAWAAAESAVRSAAWSTWSAWDATIEKIESWLLDRVKMLEEVSDDIK